LNAVQRRALIIGRGSIGIRHGRVLERMGCQVSYFSRRPSGAGGGYSSIQDALNQSRPDYAVIATETAAHLGNVRELSAAGYMGPLLVEKPLFERPHPIPNSLKANSIFVGYQLRFLRAIVELRAFVAGETCVSASLYVGQHIDTWRQGRDGHTSYSGWSVLGGGALRDLSHELDLAQWLFGSCVRISASGGRMTGVTIDSDDAWGILAEFERCPIVSLQLNYLDQPGRRRIVVVVTNRTAEIDLLSGAVKINDKMVRFEEDRDQPIEAMHRSILEKAGENACGLDSAAYVLAMIDATEQAARTKKWVAL
jgi:predicted dehydrogenase